SHVKLKHKLLLFSKTNANGFLMRKEKRKMLMRFISGQYFSFCCFAFGENIKCSNALLDIIFYRLYAIYPSRGFNTTKCGPLTKYPDCKYRAVEGRATSVTVLCNQNHVAYHLDKVKKN
uniref:Uncharacterized protein n=1 Tax=Poecilia reticulata TaxID=8081 RepID=A0A3P9P9A7_POERE